MNGSSCPSPFSRKVRSSFAAISLSQFSKIVGRATRYRGKVFHRAKIFAGDSTMPEGKPTGKVIVKPEREEAAIRRHPWLFSGSVAKIEGKVQPGDVVDIFSQNGTWLARGFINLQSEVPVRIATWNPNERLDDEWLWNRLSQAWQKRVQLGIPNET
ncbi:MAG: hypothetical protein N3B10_14865, partial [Armatimonadetes bacterium]|nr:hypothetical protein [Armatimonadota bacterium]